MEKKLYGIKGAVYAPSRTYNAYQVFEYFDEKEVDRDFSYAEDAGINAIRFFTSFEHYLKDKNSYYRKFEALLYAASRHGVRVMPVLFEDCGRPNNAESRLDRNPKTAVCVQSPDRSITDDAKLWDEPLGYLLDFMAHYKDDERLLAIEVMNEPHEANRNNDFAYYMLVNAHAVRGTVPLTIGCITLWDNLYFSKYVDIFQFHDNFPTNMEDFKKSIRRAEVIQRYTRKPVYLSEWQRLREKGPGWSTNVIAPEELPPALATLAPSVYESELAGSFFWCMMVKPAYLMEQRPNGTYNGLFHEDGSVHSLKDYEAISGKQNRNECPTIPSWYLEEKNKYCFED